MRLRFTHFSLVLFAGCATHDAAPNVADRSRPNVLVILADDLGIGDVHATNAEGKIATPHLDRLAAEGMTFSDAHSPSAVCTPTRYGLVTGRYSWRSRLAKGVLNGWSGPLIPSERATIGHLTRDAGYFTSMIGKWHLGWDWTKLEGEDLKPQDVDFTGPVSGGPGACGFEHWFAHPASLDMPPYVWVEDGAITAAPDRVEGVTAKEDRYGWYRKGPIGADFHVPEVLPRLFHEAERTVEAAAEDGRPFLMYLALPAPHTPIVPTEEFRGKSLNPYADFVCQVDHHVGELLATLEREGLDRNTIVVFTSDNGCSPQANFELLAEHGHHPSAVYRGHKADIYEGGHRVPFIVRWPGRVAPGTSSDTLVSLTDLYATIRDAAGIDDPRGGGEDGFSLVPVLTGEARDVRETAVMHSVSGHFAIRRGPWKLCMSHGSGGWSAPKEKKAKELGLPPVQLFHLGDDPGERTNLAEERPELVAELRSELLSIVERGRSDEGPALSNDRAVAIE